MSEEIISGGRYIDDEYESYGFKPGMTVWSSDSSLKVSDLKAALFDTLSSEPKTIPVKMTHGVPVQVALHMVQAVFIEDGPTFHAPGRPITYHEAPDWKFEGWVEHKGSPINGRAVRGYIIGASDPSTGSLGQMYIQLVSANPNLEGEIVCEDVDETPDES